MMQIKVQASDISLATSRTPPSRLRRQQQPSTALLLLARGYGATHTRLRDNSERRWSSWRYSPSLSHNNTAAPEKLQDIDSLCGRYRGRDLNWQRRGAALYDSGTVIDGIVFER
jgi:hypothetical protein